MMAVSYLTVRNSWIQSSNSPTIMNTPQIAVGTGSVDLSMRRVCSNVRVVRVWTVLSLSVIHNVKDNRMVSGDGLSYSMKDIITGPRVPPVFGLTNMKAIVPMLLNPVTASLGRHASTTNVLLSAY